MKFYAQTDEVNRITDVISYPAEGYAEFEFTPPLPPKVLSGCYELFDGQPIYRIEWDKDSKIEELEAKLLEFTGKPPETLEEHKAAKIKASTDALETYLAEHPMTSSVHEGIPQLYNVTSKKQGELDRFIATVERAVKLGGEQPTISWNATGNRCEPWTFDELELLSIEILQYVYPFKVKQQDLEILIKACQTIEEVQNITIDYSI